MSTDKLVSARECFQAGQAGRGLALVKEVCRNADSADVARQAFGLLQEQLAALPPRNLALTLVPLGEDPRISVIIPTKNRERMLGSALDSLAAQTWENWEGIIVNDGGNAVEAIVAASRARERLRLVNLAESLGQAAARNRAMDLASGQILCFLDDDDRFAPGHLAAIAKAMAGTRHAACYTRFETVLERIDESGRHELGRRLAYARNPDGGDDLIQFARKLYLWLVVSGNFSVATPAS